MLLTRMIFAYDFQDCLENYLGIQFCKKENFHPLLKVGVLPVEMAEFLNILSYSNPRYFKKSAA